MYFSEKYFWEVVATFAISLLLGNLNLKICQSKLHSSLVPKIKGPKESDLGVVWALPCQSIYHRNKSVSIISRPLKPQSGGAPSPTVGKRILLAFHYKFLRLQSSKKKLVLELYRAKFASNIQLGELALYRLKHS